MKTFFLFVALNIFFFGTLRALTPDSVYMSNIQTVRLYLQGNQLSFPVINLNSDQRLELHFDDLEGGYKNYYYSFQLCNFDWSPAAMMPLQYTQGFTQNRINDYKFSFAALTRYTHYKAIIPQSNSLPTKAGNYILRVYLNGDTSQIAFTKRMLVLNNKSGIIGRVTQPISPQLFQSAQKIQFNVDLSGISDYNAGQQIRIVLLQNFRWDNAITDLKPTFIRGNNLEYNSENSGIFPGGKEWRWLDIRDFHLQTDRVASADYNKNSTNIYLKTDRPWDMQPYVYYPDLDGLSNIEAVRGTNPFYESDYAMVYFSFADPDITPDAGKDIYLFGQLTNYQFSDSLKLKFNAEKNLYETRLLLKQGYYNYQYLTRDSQTPYTTHTTDGNSYETENIYTILVYYKPFGAQTEELIGEALFNSRTNNPGMSF